MMWGMTRTRSRSSLGGVVAAIAVTLVVLSPTLLLGRSPSALGLPLVGLPLIGIGLIVRRKGGGARALGTSLVIVGAVILALGIVLTALVLAGWRGY